MAIIYGQSDSLIRLLSFLKKRDTTMLLSIEDIVSFKQNYATRVSKIKKEILNDLESDIKTRKDNVLELKESFIKGLCEREALLIKERDLVSKKIADYSTKTKNILLWIYRKYKYYVLNRRLNILLNNFEEEKKRPFKELEKRINDEIKELSKLENISEQEIQSRVDLKTKIYVQLKDCLDEHNDLFLGAIGEHKAINELKKLSDAYRVINNFQLRMRKPIYNKNTGQWICSIQADHVVVGPSGIFLIETKNWSKNSIENLDLYSPVEQVRRSSFALFCYLNNSINEVFLSLFTDGWGSRKISIRNIILMVNAKPDKEYQYVKVLTLPEVCGYIKYFEPVFSEQEVNQISNYLLQ